MGTLEPTCVPSKPGFSPSTPSHLRTHNHFALSEISPHCSFRAKLMHDTYRLRVIYMPHTHSRAD